MPKKLVWREDKLSFWNRKKKRSGKLVAVCQMSSGTSAVCVQRVMDGLPALLEQSWDENVLPGPQLESLRALVKQYQWQECDAVVVLPPDFYQLMQIELADLPLGERRDAARWQIREMLEFPVAEAIVDVFDVAPFGSDKRPLTYVVAARKEVLLERRNLINDAELSLLAIDVPEFALRNLAELFVADERGTAILYLLKTGGLLTIVREGVHYLTRYLATGMNDLLPYANGDYEALTEQLDSIVLEVQRTFDYCESTFHLPLVSRLLVAQTERDIPAVTSYLNDYLATSVEPFSFDSVLTVPDGIDQLELNRHLLAIGGALRQETG